MIFNKLHIKNYRQFRDVEIEFSKDFTIITGCNGSGKTNIMGAVSWCLYGSDYTYESNYPVLNGNVANELRIGDSSEVEVTLLAEDYQGREVYFTRSLKFYKMKKEHMLTRIMSLIFLLRLCKFHSNILM